MSFRTASKQTMASVRSARSLWRNSRMYSTPSVEDTIRHKLQTAFNPSELKVADTSGGCGSFFSIDIVSSAFNGVSTVKRQRMVNQAIKEEVSGMHGMTMRTFAEDEAAKK